jgi:oxygen-independent coproporphyrinogen-3 oxidase
VRKAGFKNLNLDLIFGIPGQTLASWRKTLGYALNLKPEHLAIYALTIEDGTPFGLWSKGGMLPLLDDDLAAEMYELASETLDLHGYAQYEISNWALSTNNKSDLSCRHNLQYWRNLNYIGIGAGAHGYAAGKRTANLLSPSAYIQRIAGVQGNQPGVDFPITPATQSFKSIDLPTEMAETMITGLRLTREGVSAEAFQARFGKPLEDVYAQQIERLIRLVLLEWKKENRTSLRLTQRGRLLANQVLVEFI